MSVSGEVVLGLDGGGTKTEVAVVDHQARVLRWVAGPGLDPTSGEDWQGRLAGLVAGVTPVAARLGLPYFSEVPEISALQQEVAGRLLGPGALVRNDVDLAFEGALGGAQGVLVLSGTGSMAWARGARGAARAGGFGDVFGDEGSAHWIGVQALNLVSRHLDGRRQSKAFAEGVLEGLGLAGAPPLPSSPTGAEARARMDLGAQVPGQVAPSPSWGGVGVGGTFAGGAGPALIAWTYGAGASRASVAQVARIVGRLAEAGEGEALRLLHAAARELAALARAAARAAGADVRVWSHAGGVLGNPVVRDYLAKALGAAPRAPVLPPVGGAVLAAARAAGWDTGDDFTGRLAQGLREAAESGN